MSSERFVVLGLAHVRSSWFTEVARWATAGSLPVEFVKCVSAEQLRAHVGSGRPFSAALVDGRLATVDRDLLAVLTARGCTPIVVADATRPADWLALGASAVLTPPVERSALLDALVRHSHAIDPLDRPAIDPRPSTEQPGWRAPLVAVTGRGGAGVSTIAAVTAHALATDPRHAHDVLLADLARHAHQGLLHDARDVVPGLQDLVDAHRRGTVAPADIRRLTFDVPARSYRLLLGLRSPHDWVTLPNAAFDRALDALRGACRLLVADVDDDVEGEEQTGSFDVEDRNHRSRRAIVTADLVISVALPTAPGMYELVRHLHDLRRVGVAPTRHLVVINRAPHRARPRAELSRSLADLAEAAGRIGFVGPVFVPDRRGVDDLHRDLVPFPHALTASIRAAASAVLDRAGARSTEPEADGAPVRIEPGSLGSWGADAIASADADPALDQ